MLLDPSKLRIVDVNAIWDHWVRRQNNDERGLVFVRAHAGDMRVKAKGGSPVKASGDGKGSDSEEDQGGSADKDDKASEPHPDSPAAHALSLKDRLKFLKGLSGEKVYQKKVEELSKTPVSALLQTPVYMVTWSMG